MPSLGPATRTWCETKPPLLCLYLIETPSLKKVITVLILPGPVTNRTLLRTRSIALVPVSLALRSLARWTWETINVWPNNGPILSTCPLLTVLPCTLIDTGCMASLRRRFSLRLVLLLLPRAPTCTKTPKVSSVRT